MSDDPVLVEILRLQDEVRDNLRERDDWKAHEPHVRAPFNTV